MTAMTTATKAASTRADYLPVRPNRLNLSGFAARSGLHPDLVRRFVALGLIDAYVDSTGALWFRPSEAYNVARIERLRTGLDLNYAAIGLVMDLLDEIDELHAAAHSPTRASKERALEGGRA
jgi:MerR HTH family regulatory protein